MTSAETLCALVLLCAAGCGDDPDPLVDAALADVMLPGDAGMETTTLGECVSEVGVPVDADFEPDRFFQLMDFSNEELGIRMRVALSPAPVEQLIGLAINYNTRAVAVEDAEGVSCIRDQTGLSYDVTHHNDTDTFTASLSPDDRYVVSMIYDRVTSSFTDTLTIEHPESQEPDDGPYPLVEAGCSVHREDGVSDCTYQVRPPY